MMSGNGGAQQGYVGIAAVDRDHQVIVEANVTGDSEQSAFQSMVDKLIATDRLSDAKLLAKVPLINGHFS